MATTVEELFEEMEEEQDISSTEVFVAADGYETISAYKDAEVIEITNKTISSLLAQISTQGESNSQYILFQRERYADGIDLANKLIQVHYEREDGVGDNNAPINVEYSENYIRFGWLIPRKAVLYSGTLKVMPFLYGLDPNGDTYIIKDLYVEYTINENLEISGGITEPDSDWYTQFLKRMDTYLTDATTALTSAVESAEKAATSAAELTSSIEELSSLKSRVGTNESDIDSLEKKITSEISRSVAKDTELEELFSLPTEEAVAKWLNEHPEATTTVQDGALTEAKFSDELKLYAIKDYVTPEMFGAVGDGVTDDTEAIQKALDANYNNQVIFSDKTYITTSPLQIKSGRILVGGFGTVIKNTTSDMIELVPDHVNEQYGYGYVSSVYIEKIRFISNYTTNFIHNEDEVFFNWSKLFYVRCNFFDSVFSKETSTFYATGLVIHNLDVNENRFLGVIQGSDNSFCHWYFISGIASSENRPEYYLILYGLLLTTIFDFYITGAIDQGNGPESIMRVINSKGLLINHIIFDYCDKYAIDIKNSNGIRIIDCAFRGNARDDNSYVIRTIGSEVKITMNDFKYVHKGNEMSATSKVYYVDANSNISIIDNHYEYADDIKDNRIIDFPRNFYFVFDEPQFDFTFDAYNGSKILKNKSTNKIYSMGIGTTTFTTRYSKYPFTMASTAWHASTVLTGTVPYVYAKYAPVSVRINNEDVLPVNIGVRHAYIDENPNDANTFNVIVVWYNNSATDFTVDVDIEYTIKIG